MMQEKQKTEPDMLSGDTNHNPLVSAANPLLNTIPQIRHSTVHPDPAHLRQQLINEIRRFEVECQQAKLPYAVIIGARYCLCTALDEAAALTPWGVRSVWSGSGLLVTFHNETWGGEKFFQLLAKLSQNPRDNLFLLELINFCLQLGFEGRYRVMDNGRTQLETVKQRLFQLIRSMRGSYPAELSQKVRAITAPIKSRHFSLPVWISTIILIFLVGILYISLNWRLNDIVNPILAKIYQTNLPNLVVSDRVSPPVPPTLNLQSMLREEVAEELLTVTDLPDRSVITLKGDGLFNTSAIQVKSRYLDVIRRVAEALNHFNGEILVVGYTDNIPIKSRRFPSNYALSLARAKSVKKELQRYLNQPERVKTEGRGASDPLVPNNSADNRAKNRRVEITLLVSPVNQTMQGN
ncbi:DotU family type VI secretion system protein [Xenorhabdus sp. DI]|uniref:DotU family type VI secretion system protein n=1 Tax=Xenorhabdus doucetiae TaxID=351671 RepID=UPI0019B2FDF1|nr:MULTISPECIES: DotU family type VI secretion system protein [unclassified Xenorhabdus]MBD2785625.1 DotU family type VI secretion system protein [Xenorhabdus sp. 3]MBD2787010.1 DotU family type VI secretion system protein [Xenorhabdus sp. DI]MBD2796724.1 DotU family type VI secretion system protein [Xenorhabdus sp. 18]